MTLLAYSLKMTLYLVAVLWSAASAILLFHRYMQHRTRFLMWSSIGLAGLTVNNAALIINVALPDFDLRLARLIPSLIGLACLLYGLRWSTE